MFTFAARKRQNKKVVVAAHSMGSTVLLVRLSCFPSFDKLFYSLCDSTCKSETLYEFLVALNACQIVLCNLFTPLLYTWFTTASNGWNHLSMGVVAQIG